MTYVRPSATVVVMQTLGSYLRTARESKGFSLRELARRLNLSAPFVSDVERNRRGMGAAPYVAQWCAEVGADGAEVDRLSGRLPIGMLEWLLADGKRLSVVRKMMERGEK